jgi:hypothetical protein
MEFRQFCQFNASHSLSPGTVLHSWLIEIVSELCVSLPISRIAFFDQELSDAFWLSCDAAIDPCDDFAPHCRLCTALFSMTFHFHQFHANHADDSRLFKSK